MIILASPVESGAALVFLDINIGSVVFGQHFSVMQVGVPFHNRSNEFCSPTLVQDARVDTFPNRPEQCVLWEAAWIPVEALQPFGGIAERDGRDAARRRAWN